MFKKGVFILILTVFVTQILSAAIVNSLLDTNQNIRFVSKFSDISSHWAKGIIEKYEAKGIVKGMVDGIFSPDSKITRVQFFTLIHKGMNIQIRYVVAPDFTNIYKDVKNEDWYAIIVYDLYSIGVIDDKDYLRGNEYITREEMAHYVVNAYKNSEEDFLEEGFNDIKPKLSDDDKISPKYKNDIYYAYNAKIIRGKPGGLFDPKNFSTRAEGLVVVDNLLSTMGVKNLASYKIDPSYSIDTNGLKMVISIKNQGSNPLDIVHSSGQKYDFELLDTNKGVIYRWSKDRMFIEEIQQTTVDVNSSLDFFEVIPNKGNEGILKNAKYLVCYLKGTIENEQINPSGFTIELNKDKQNS